MATVAGDRTTIYSVAFIQGAVAVVFAADTAIMVARSHYALTLPQYGVLFIPQVVAVVAAVMFAATINCWFRAVRLYRAGLTCSLAGLALLVATEWAARLPVTYPLLLAATAFVGAGLGLTFPFVRSAAAGLKPVRGRRQVILVNALVAAGMATAPAYALATTGTAIWWSLPVLLGVFVIAAMLLSRSLRTPPDGVPARAAEQRVPARFRVYPVLALLFAICAVILITASQRLTGGFSPVRMNFLTLAEVGFWAGLVQSSRVVFTLIDGMKSRRQVASIGVFLIAVAILVLSLVMTQYDIMHVGIYSLAGIGCAALLPIDTRPGNEHIAALPFAATAGVLALFPVGVGLSALGYAIATRNGVTPIEIYLGVAAVGAAACMMLFPVILNWRTMGYFDQPARPSMQSLPAPDDGAPE